MSAADKISRARAALTFSQPFFATLALGMRVSVTDTVRTCATDGVSFFANPEFIETINPLELEGVWVHEILHVANCHHTRRAGRDLKLWNQACDYAINPLVLAAGFKLPAGALIDRRYIGLPAEEIYRLLESQNQNGGGQSQQQNPGAGGAGQQQPGASNGQGAPAQGKPQSGAGQQAQPGNGAPQSATCGDPGGCGEILDAAPAHETAALEAAEAETLARVRQAIAVARAQGAGEIPGDLARVVEALNQPRMNWREMLRRFIDNSTSRDYSWMRPNRRHIASGLILPGYVPDRPSHVVAVMDTSGSVRDLDVAAFASELQAMLDEGAADRVTVAYADTRVKSHAEFIAGDLLDVKPAGGGGTSFRQPLEWVRDNCADATAIVYMTDADCTEWGEQPAAPILWLCTGTPQRARALVSRAPFGEAHILNA